MRITSTIGRRAAALVAAGAIATTLGVAVATPADAAPVLGTLTITPATGNELTGLNATLSTSCPGDSTGIVGYMSGPGIASQNDGVLQANRAPATSFQISSVFKDVFANNSIAAPNGTYTVRMACIGSDFVTENGEFSQQVTFTPRAGFQNGATYVTQTPAIPTTTTLATPSVVDPIVAGTSVTLNATVDGGSAGTPTGAVQFKGGSAGTTNIGSPVALVSGAASLTTTAIPAGTNTLKATYVPSGANALGASNSNTISYVVAGPVTLAGLAKVGKALTCSTAAATGATRTYSWFRNGVATGVTTATVTVPVTWYNTLVSCKATTTKNATTVEQTSNTAKVALGSALVYTVRPKVLGIARVGRVLTCAHGTWSPAATSYRYQWFRGTRALVGKTGVKYKTVRADRGKLITCRVTAIKAGYASGVAKAPARKVK